jgi:electron transfer flavoprotein-quinone oxidoreductase
MGGPLTAAPAPELSVRARPHGAAVDVAVVGAGPAGATAALVLARAGVRVALLDRAPLPRS